MTTDTMRAEFEAWATKNRIERFHWDRAWLAFQFAWQASGANRAPPKTTGEAGMSDVEKALREAIRQLKLACDTLEMGGIAELTPMYTAIVNGEAALAAQQNSHSAEILYRAQHVAMIQAEDEGLWFKAKTAP